MAKKTTTTKVSKKPVKKSTAKTATKKVTKESTKKVDKKEPQKSEVSTVTVSSLKAELTALKVEFPAKAKKAELQSLLDNHKSKIEKKAKPARSFRNEH